MQIRNILGAAALVMVSANGANAQFMTAAEVKPILDVTSGSWVAIREWDGNDLVYFTHLETFRCGLSGVRYGINSDVADTPYALEECFEGTAAPNALDPTVHDIYITLPLGSVQKITVDVKYDDGSVTSVTFDRASIQIQ